MYIDNTLFKSWLYELKQNLSQQRVTIYQQQSITVKFKCKNYASKDEQTNQTYNQIN